MVVIETSDEDTDDSWKENTGEINLSAIEVSGAGVSVSDNVVTNTAGGVGGFGKGGRTRQQLEQPQSGAEI